MKNCPAPLFIPKLYGLGLVWFGEFNPADKETQGNHSELGGPQITHQLQCPVQIPLKHPEMAPLHPLTLSPFLEGHED